MSQKKRKYQDNYMDFGFTYLIEDDLQIPQCVVCMKTFSNSTMKPASLKQHLTNAHPSMMSKNRSFFESKLSSLKRQKLDQTGMFWRTNKAAVHASYATALHVAKTKKPHNIGETLLKPCILESVKLVLGKKASQTMKQISLSNDKIKSRIHEMSDNIKSKVLSKIDCSPVFALQLDERTGISNLSQLLVYVRYVADERINEEFLFCQPLETTSKAVDVFQMLIDFFDKTELSWSKLVGVCTDGAPAMIGANSGLIFLVKQKNPAIQGTHCMVHKSALVSKTIQVIQEEFTKLTNDSLTKDEFHSCKLEEFWVKMQHCYPRIGIQALNILVPFSSTYLCECGFSALLTIKSKARNRLHVQSDIRCVLSTTLPDFEKLVAEKQGHPSQ